MNMNNYLSYEFPDAKSVVVSGDIHGDFTQLVYKCCIQYGMTDTVIIVAGDCGFLIREAGLLRESVQAMSRAALEG